MHEKEEFRQCEIVEPPDLFRSRRLKINMILVAALLTIHGLVNDVFAKEHSSEQLDSNFLAFMSDVLQKMEKFVFKDDMCRKIHRVYETFMMRRAAGFLGGGFGYEFCDNCMRVSYDPKNRNVRLGPGFDVENVCDLTSLAHEISHVEHGDKLNEDLFRRDENAKEKDEVIVVLDNEVDAISREIEILNVATSGKLKDSILNNKPFKLGCADEQTELFLMRCAEVYYLTPDKFAAFVEEIYKAIPDVTIISRSGGL